MFCSVSILFAAGFTVCLVFILSFHSSQLLIANSLMNFQLHLNVSQAPWDMNE